MREIIFFENHFIEFYKNQNLQVKEKIQYVLELIRLVDRVPKKFLKHLSDTDGLYEIRISYHSNVYRIFCCFDEGKLVILFNAFQKKSQKTPKNEIKKALRLKQLYFDQKIKNGQI